MQTTMNTLNRAARILTGLVLPCFSIFQFLITGMAFAASFTKLGWDESPDANIAGYNIYRSNQSGSYTSAPLNGASLISTVSFTDSAALSGTYYYVVRAVDRAGHESPASNEVQAVVRTSPINTAQVAAPTGLTSNCSSDAKTFTVKWYPVPDAQSYYLRVDYVANNVNGRWYIADGVDYNLDDYTNTTFTGNVVAGQTYSWWVHAANSTTGIGPWSSGVFTCSSPNAAPVANAGP